jgi:FKBP-type peptidyl-prolyl cis-trans isomerase FklB
MTRERLIKIAVLLAALPGISGAQAELSTEEQKFSYAMGFKVATQLQQKLRRRGMQLDAPAFVQAVQDVLSGTPPQLSEGEMHVVIQIQQAQQVREQASEAINNKLAGDNFRETYRVNAGVIETTSGLQYRVLKEGEGKHPTAKDRVVVNYRGTLVNGKEFDSSYDRGKPSTFDLNKVLNGLREALQLMQEGAKWELVIPPPRNSPMASRAVAISVLTRR